MKKNESIQILRAIAALLVVYVHSIDLVGLHSNPHQRGFFNLTHFGACGVDIFFAISGFILSTVVLRSRPGTPQASGDFLLRRFIRIFPIYWILSLFFAGLAIRQHRFTFIGALDSYLLMPSLQYPMQAPLMFIGWTLMFEMYFYYLLSLNMLFGRRNVVQRTIAAILGIVVLGTLLNFKRPILIFIANPLAIEFVFGCIIALAFQRFGPRKRLGNLLLILGSASLASTILWGNYNTGIAEYTLDGTLSWYRVLVWGIPAAILTAGVVFHTVDITSAVGRLFVFLGDASYSIYLISLIVLQCLDRLYNFVPPPLNPDLNIFVCMAIVAAAGSICYLSIEAPITRYLSHRYHHRTIQVAP